MSSEPKTITVGYYLLHIADYLDQRLEKGFGTTLLEKFVSYICTDCRARLNAVTIPSGTDSPSEMGDMILYGAAYAAGLFPTTEAIPLDGRFLAHSLQYEFNLHAALKLGHCDHAPSAGRAFVNKLYKSAQQRSMSNFWRSLSQDAHFIRAYSQACARLDCRMTPSTIRMRLIVLCFKLDLHTPGEAIPLLEGIVDECVAHQVH